MTREKAIEILTESKRQNEIIQDNPNTFFGLSNIVSGVKNAQERIDALGMAISALREQEEREKPLSAFLTPMDSYKGLKRKFLVFKSDTGEMIENCFVLRPDKDPAAAAALRAYAGATDNKTLAADIISWVGSEPNNPLTLDELRRMDGQPVFLVDLVHKSDKEVPDLWGGWIVFTSHNTNGFIPRGGGFFSNDGYGKTWLAYRSKPKEE